jgi:type II pantothenate kinase
MQAAIDFGISNTDAVAEVDGELRHWVQPFRGRPDADLVRLVLDAGGIDISALHQLAVTGGHSQGLPAQIDGCAVMHINEVQAMARGGQALLDIAPADPTPLLITSAGSGVAILAARGAAYTHVTGSGVGGGTLLGLGRLLLDTNDPREIDALAQRGDPNGPDLSLVDVVSGPIGTLPPDTTAVNFGRLAHPGAAASREDVAAALVTLVGQVIGTIAINAARAQSIKRVVVTGHLTDMPTMRAAIARTSAFFGLPFEMPIPAGHATALGALRSLPA